MQFDAQQLLQIESDSYLLPFGSRKGSMYISNHFNATQAFHNSLLRDGLVVDWSMLAA